LPKQPKSLKNFNLAMIYEKEPSILDPVLYPFYKGYELCGLAWTLTVYGLLEIGKAITSPYTFAVLVLVVHIAILLRMPFFELFDFTVEAQFGLTRTVWASINETLRITDEAAVSTVDYYITTLVRMFAIGAQTTISFMGLVAYYLMWKVVRRVIRQWSYAKSMQYVSLTVREIDVELQHDEKGYFLMFPGTEEDPNPTRINMPEKDAMSVLVQRLLRQQEGTTVAQTPTDPITREMSIPNSYMSKMAVAPSALAVIHNGVKNQQSLEHIEYGTICRINLDGDPNHAVTAAHVFRGLQKSGGKVYVRVTNKNGEFADAELPVQEARIVVYSSPSNLDVVVFKLPPYFWANVKMKTAKMGPPPKVGETVTVYTPLLHGHWAVSRGHVTNYQPKMQMVHSASTAPGSSGTPIIDNRGRIVAIHIGCNNRKVANLATVCSIFTDFRKETPTRRYEGFDQDEYDARMDAEYDRMEQAIVEFEDRITQKRERRNYACGPESVVLTKTGPVQNTGRCWADYTDDDEPYVMDSDNDFYEEESKHSGPDRRINESSITHKL